MARKFRSSGERRRIISHDFHGRVSRREDLKIRGAQDREAFWFGLGTFGVVGWSVVIPTLVGVALGVWIDRTWPGRFSWTLMLLIGGVMLGCVNAWYWVKKIGIRGEK
ncbi:MAG: putative F0F1-ATPase [Syntrophus sp. PtaB.Bin001]|jgi:ATP synthase protein I|nr:MAG: putative F0F1-ATPase [Syntrophus sp. PtaB.Bin001]